MENNLALVMKNVSIFSQLNLLLSILWVKSRKCDQIWQNFDTLATFYKSLTIFRLYLVD